MKKFFVPVIQTVLAGAILAAPVAIFRFQQATHDQFSKVNERLLRIETKLGIEPQLTYAPTQKTR